ncbi:CubicO group peptidase (beta-lactamase class C family) [Gelidibacter algens]|jgi:CubicO group peptidase (beta-lactamase class C family)|uniref:CubicO group peptidase (Beta-lactamase class C family) n=1 Tax=Gelidibacter algens TaxID=49280 RepID=A0A1A7R4J3_9FLAO|nr:serine hydrolase [Gelidibacter algens]OBX27175.1 penicillin-binding protein [Gelidibacter algens]RAJ22027.1 CubicO group peptidase (beta-lactamase class C family) [Gelidibacter algens]
MKKFICLLFCFVLFTSINAQTDKRLKGIEKDLNAILEATKAPGFSVAVVDGDKIIYAKGFGYRDYENKVPVDANTLFAIGSSTKAFTSALLGQLRAEDKLSFDDSPITYIPKLKFYNDDLDNHIIIKDLMRHSTGLPRHDLSWYLFPSADKDSLIERIAYQEPFTDLRKEWHYNNFMFLAQGVIAEKITGQSWEDNIKTRFFEPLGMSRSQTLLTDLEKSDNAALGYELKKDDKISKMDYYDISGMSPAGSIYSSANDMAKWLKMWINKGKHNAEEILPEAYISEAMSSQMVMTGALPDKENPDLHFANYGYGWMLSSYKGHYRVEHGGNIDGFSASVAFFPSDSLGVVVLANQNGSSVPNLVRNTIADRLLGEKTTDWTKRFLEGQEKAKKMEEELKLNDTSTQIKNTSPSHIKQEYSGSYENAGYGSFDVAVENDSLFASFKRMKVYLKHYHYDVFEPYEVTKTGIDTTDAGPMRFNFATNDVGDISSVSLKAEAALEPIVFKRTPNTIDVSSSDLEKYVGDYSLMGTPLKIYTKNETVLYLFVPGQPEYELMPTEKHKFSLKVLDGYKIEFLETDKVITDMNLIQPNGTFKAKKE